jgi:ubiquitin fusion degradation protein 1
MLFEISNVKEQRKSHCGVLEFVAEEGVAYMPYWVRAQVITHFVMPWV